MSARGACARAVRRWMDACAPRVRRRRCSVLSIMLMSSHTMYDGIELHSKVASRDSKVTLIHALYPAARGSLTRDGAALKPAGSCVLTTSVSARVGVYASPRARRTRTRPPARQQHTRSRTSPRRESGTLSAARRGTDFGPCLIHDCPCDARSSLLAKLLVCVPEPRTWPALRAPDADRTAILRYRLRYTSIRGKSYM